MSVLGNNILAGASGQGGVYTIDRSLRFRSSASAYLNRTPASAGNRKTWTWSGWVKFGSLTGTYTRLFSTGTSANNRTEILFITNTNQIRFFSTVTGTSRGLIDTAAYLRDPSAWYHLVVSLDASSTTLTMYINGVQQTLTTSTAIANVDHMVNATNTHSIGRYWGAGNHFDGYMTEINFVDGQALDASSFGEYNSDTGVWQPIKYVGTYGTNGFYLNFSDNSTTTTLGYDTSGNGNNWTANNISVTSGATYDSMTDVPTLTDDDAANYATLNPINPLSNGTEVDGNLKTTLGVNGIGYPTIPFPTSGKWYAEITCTATTTYGIAIGLTSTPTASLGTVDSNFYGYYNANGNKYVATVISSYGSSWFGARTDVIGVAFDADTRELTMYLNGASQGVLATLPSGREWFLTGQHWSGTGSHIQYWNFGQRPFAYTPPTGFKSLNTYNLPDSTIVDGSQYFDVRTWSGDSVTPKAVVTDLGFQPDLIWAKTRSTTYDHMLFDSVRGAGSTKDLSSNTTSAEGTSGASYGYVSSIDSAGFTVTKGSLATNVLNQSGQTFAAWNWKANGSGVSNTDGSITSTVSANTTAGFSIVTYTGTGSAATVGHGLGVAPSMIIVKPRTPTSTSDNWEVYHASLGNTQFLTLNTSAAAVTASNRWNNTTPTSSVFTIGTIPSSSADNYVAYLFADVEGYSKFGSYTGNGSTDGPFVYTGFRPAFVLFKRTDSTSDWHLYDTTRSTYNVIAAALYADISNAENSGQPFDILSNGFKLRVAGGELNTSSATIIYMAFAENPFKNSLAR